MLTREHAPLSELTTLRLGGPARRIVEAQSAEEVVEVVAAADAEGEALLVLAGGSNLVVSDEGFDGTVLRIATRGITEDRSGERSSSLRVAAGESWDAVVSFSLSAGLAGIECLSGIPGSAGATPIQNVGAYGEEVAETLVSVRAYDRAAGVVIDLSREQCGFSYRSSALRHSDRYVVLEVIFELERSPAARPVRYAELARALGVGLGARPPCGAVRETVLALRAGKGMVLDRSDPDSVSAGSFFVNPLLSREEFLALERRASVRLDESHRPPAWPEADGRVKTSAAWLIERAGFHRGYGNGRVGISRKHTLALVNRGDASTAELLALAREVRDGVREAFDIELQPEPTLIGVEL